MNGGQGGEIRLVDVPPALLGPLLRAVRRAMNKLDRSALPPVVRPFAGWKPERLAGDRPLQAISLALESDVRLREAVGESLADAALYEVAREGDPDELLARFGAGPTIAGLVVHGRWQELAAVAEQTGPADPPDAARGEQESRLRGEVAEALAERDAARADRARVRDERDALRRRAEAAEQRGRSERSERARLEATIADLRSQLERELTGRAEEVRRLRERIERLRRRAEQAERQRDVDRRGIARQLEKLAGELCAAVREGAPLASATEAEREAPPAVPRDVVPALAGRPARLPPGLPQDHPDAVRALLFLPELEVIVDGYNVSKDQRGQPAAELEDQRRWLVQVAAGAAARYRHRFVVVFDGTEPAPATVGGRGRDVVVAFTSGQQTADERIVEIVQVLPRDAPVLVVSSDKAVRAACASLGANTAASAAFLDAVRA